MRRWVALPIVLAVAIFAATAAKPPVDREAVKGLER